MRIVKFFALLHLIILLGACSSSLKVQQLPPQNVESQSFVLTQISPKSEKSLLVIQYLPNQWRWIQTDPLGSPISRLQLTQQGWKNDGFIMPNQQAEQLFSAIATYLSPNFPLFNLNQIKASATITDYFYQDKKLWRIGVIGEKINILLKDNSQWILEQIEE